MMKGDISMDSTIVRNEAIPSTEIDGEIGLMNIKTGKYFSLNAVGSDIWNNLDKPKSFIELIDTLTSEYAVDRDSCIAEVMVFIRKMIDEGIVLQK